VWRVTNPSSENTPRPDPKKEEGADETDLSKASLPKGGHEMPEQLEGTPAASSQPTESAEHGSGPHVSLLQSLRAICNRQDEAAEAGGRRPRLTEDEMDALVRAATLVREKYDQSKAPPVDYELVCKATWNQLPNDLAEMVQGLRIKYRIWNDALLAEEMRAIAIQDAAKSN
jgi:hypothetical protein